MNDSKLWYLKRCDLFERLTPEQAAQLDRRAAIRSFRKGELIYFPDDESKSVLVVARGRVKIKGITPDGKEYILAFIEEGEIFGELALVSDGPRDEFAEAAEATAVLALAREDLVWLIEQRPDLALQITKLLGLRRKQIENRLRNLLFRNNRQRVAGVLLELLESHGQRNGQGWEIGLRLSHQDLASLIGATRETVTIVLGQMQLDGLIRVRRKCITVLDREGLTEETSL
ncbi:Crp/Fnr family transcriptional regulator [Tautonia sociabilis]|nr:Crp/Fnr family transcriptional regulator [Tautonia sociabilis]